MEATTAIIERLNKELKLAAVKDPSTLIGRSIVSTDVALLKDANIIIYGTRAYTIEEKQKSYSALDSVCKKDAVVILDAEHFGIRDIIGKSTRATNVLASRKYHPLPLT